MINEAKEKLQRLRKSEKDWDPSTLEIFKQWEQRLNELDLDKNYLELPQSIKIADDLRNKLQNVNDLLLTERNISADGRNSLFNMKEVIEMLLSHYSLEENLKQTSLIEEEIKNNL